jgi:hypothetical protein
METIALLELSIRCDVHLSQLKVPVSALRVELSLHQLTQAAAGPRVECERNELTAAKETIEPRHEIDSSSSRGVLAEIPSPQ